MTLAAELESQIREFTSAATVEVREQGGRPVPFAELSWVVRGAPEQPLLHLWSGTYNVTRRVLAITDRSEARLALAVERFGRRRPERLEFVRVEFERSARELARNEFSARLTRILAEQFPDETLESMTAAPDLEHSLSGNYARGILRRGSRSWAMLAVPDKESADTIDNSLAFALLWLDRIRQTPRRGVIAGLRLIVPKGSAAGIAHRCRALQPQLAIQLYERDSVAESIQEVELASVANVGTRLVAHREAQLLLDRARPDLDDIVELSPRAIRIHANVVARQVWLRFRGLAFAKWHDGRVYFGPGEAREELTLKSRAALKRLIRDLECYRSAAGGDTRHRLYRAQPERWLESMVREDVSALDAVLDSRFAYAQVFENSGGEHGIIDVLAVTRSGRLAVIELKASEHIHLPLQAADYWLRVRGHLVRGDFPRQGYFPGVQLQSTAPLVYLVAPALHFHPATDALLRHLTPELPVIRLGLAENWRQGISVVMRQ